MKLAGGWLGVGGLGVGELGVGGLGVGVKWVSGRHSGMSRLHTAVAIENSDVPGAASEKLDEFKGRLQHRVAAFTSATFLSLQSFPSVAVTPRY